MKRAFVTFLVLFIAHITNAQTAVKLQDLSQHIGDSVTICGKVDDLRYFESYRNSPTFLSIGGKYPGQLLTVVIWGDVRKRFKDNPDDLKNKEVCITGRLVLYKEKPEIIIGQPADILIQ